MTFTTLIVFAVCAVWIGGAYWFYSRKPKLIAMVVGSGAVKGDNEVLVMPKPIIVNVVYHSQEETLDTSAIADVVVNYRDLVNGKFNFVGVSSQDGGDGFKSKSFRYEKKEEEEKSFSHDDESPTPPYSTSPKKDEDRDPDDDQDEKDEEITGAPEFSPTPGENDIPQSDETEDSLTSTAIMDLNKLNLNI